MPIEDNLKSELVEIASQIMIVGDKKKHLAVIITLKTILDDKNQPTDILSEDVQEWLQTFGSKATTAKELIAEDNEEVKTYIRDAIKRSNTRSVSNASKVHKFMIAPTDFSLAGGEKLKHKQINTSCQLKHFSDSPWILQPFFFRGTDSNSQGQETLCC